MSILKKYGGGDPTKPTTDKPAKTGTQIDEERKEFIRKNREHRAKLLKEWNTGLKDRGGKTYTLPEASRNLTFKKGGKLLYKKKSKMC